MARETPVDPWPGGLSIHPSYGPDQVDFTHTTEYKNSRTITKDLQRETIIERWVLRGTPDVANLDASLSAYKTGMPNPWFPKNPGGGAEGLSNSYITSVKFEHLCFGTNPPNTGTQDEAQAWTIMTVVFTQRPCPALYEEQWTVALQSQSEWYSVPMTPAEKQAGDEYPGRDEEGDAVPTFLSRSLNPVPILRPVPVYQRKYLKIALSKTQLKNLRASVGKLNGLEFMDEEPGYWMFDGMNATLLHGNDDPQRPDRGWYEVLLVFRGDPLRHHQFAAPKKDPQSSMPVNPARNPELYPDYASLHSFKKQYSFDMRDWNNLTQGINAFSTCRREDTQLPDSDT